MSWMDATKWIVRPKRCSGCNKPMSLYLDIQAHKAEATATWNCRTEDCNSREGAMGIPFLREDLTAKDLRRFDYGLTSLWAQHALMTKEKVTEASPDVAESLFHGIVRLLDREGLLELLAMVQSRLAEMEEELEPIQEPSSSGPAGKASKARGWIELKMIPRGGKEYGPYAYRRWRSGGRIRSEYLGKVKQES